MLCFDTVYSTCLFYICYTILVFDIFNFNKMASQVSRCGKEHFTIKYFVSFPKNDEVRDAPRQIGPEAEVGNTNYIPKLFQRHNKHKRADTKIFAR